MKATEHLYSQVEYFKRTYEGLETCAEGEETQRVEDDELIDMAISGKIFKLKTLKNYEDATNYGDRITLRRFFWYDEEDEEETTDSLFEVYE